jgi:hypothetical protein
VANSKRLGCVEISTSPSSNATLLVIHPQITLIRVCDALLAIAFAFIGFCLIFLHVRAVDQYDLAFLKICGTLVLLLSILGMALPIFTIFGSETLIVNGDQITIRARLSTLSHKRLFALKNCGHFQTWKVRRRGGIEIHHIAFGVGDTLIKSYRGLTRSEAEFAVHELNLRLRKVELEQRATKNETPEK